MALNSLSDRAIDATPRSEDEILRILLTLDEGWWSDLQISWEIGGQDLDARRAVRGVLSAVGQTGVQERIFVRHRGGEPFAVTRVDHAAIREALDENQ
jgi:hypothetical protein